MTHNELSIEVNRRLQVALYNGDIPAVHALKSVVELHKPVIHALPDETCWACQDLYPCPTIRAIEKELL